MRLRAFEMVRTMRWSCQKGFDVRNTLAMSTAKSMDITKFKAELEAAAAKKKKKDEKEAEEQKKMLKELMMQAKEKHSREN